MVAPGKVVLVNSNRMRPAVAPLALDYLAPALRREGLEVDILDLCFAADPAQAIDDYFACSEVAAVGITLRNTDDTSFASSDFFVPQLKEVTDRIRAKTAAPIILGGAGFSIMPEAILGYCGLDLGVWGEGEYSLPLLVSRLARGEEFRDVPGVVFRWRNSFVEPPANSSCLIDSSGGAECLREVKNSFLRNLAEYIDLSQIDTPSRDAVDNRRYFIEGGQGAIETKRGCPMRCIYCADPLGKGTQLRLRSPASVADEVEALLRLGIDHLHLCDSEFNIPPGHARAVCEELVVRGLGDRVRWYTYASPTPFSAEAAALWQRAGCVGVNFGVDSASDAVLRKLGRHFSAADLKETAELCQRQGLVFMYDLLLGGPGETRETVRETIEAMKRLSPHRVGASLGVRIFPATRLAGQLQLEGPLSKNPNLRGEVEGNHDFFAPIFYLSSALGPQPGEYLARLIGGDERFFLMSQGEAGQNYNYNENTTLVQAIRAGHRGAFWDILRRVS